MRSKIVREAKHFLNNPSIFPMKLLMLLILPAELCQVFSFLCSVFWVLMFHHGLNQTDLASKSALSNPVYARGLGGGNGGRGWPGR